MKDKLILLGTLRKDITILFFICLIIIICIDFWLINISEKITYGSKIGVIVEKLSLSYISAFIFYFLIVHIKTQKDKANIYTYVNTKVIIILGSCTGLLNELSKASNSNLKEKYPNSEELTQMFLKINPNENAPLLLSATSNNYANWIQYFEYFNKRSNDATEKIFLKMPFLDTKLVSLLAKIDDCSHFMVIRNVVNTMPIRNTDLTFVQNTFKDYVELIKELEKYSEKKLKNYK